MPIAAPAEYRSSPLHGGALDAVDQAFEHPPVNVRAEDVVVTGEGKPVCIVLIPHRQLGGVTLIVWSDAKGVQLRWGIVASLQYHDEIDLSTRVDGPIAAEDVAAIGRAISREMKRPITVQLRSRGFGKPRLECTLDVDGRSKVIGHLRVGRQAAFAGTLTTTLAECPLPAEIAVPAASLRSSA